MIRLRIALCAAIAAGTAAVAVPAAAEDVPPPSTTATVTHVRPVVIATATRASVLFHYSCVAVSPADAHLYLAVKEGPTISPTNTSSAGATSYFSTNWSVDQGPNALKCDGKRHTMHAVLHADGIPTGPPPDENTPPPTRPSPPLARGRALVQICVFDTSGLTMNYSMKRVVRG